MKKQIILIFTVALLLITVACGHETKNDSASDEARRDVGTIDTAVTEESGPTDGEEIADDHTQEQEQCPESEKNTTVSIPVTQDQSTQRSTESQQAVPQVETAEEMPVVTTKAFDDILAAAAQGTLSRDWETFRETLAQIGYTVIEDEGTFCIYDTINGDSYLYGNLGNEGTDTASVSFIGYQLISGTANRAVEVRFDDGYPRYYNETFSGSEGWEVQSIDGIRDWLVNGYGC